MPDGDAEPDSPLDGEPEPELEPGEPDEPDSPVDGEPEPELEPGEPDEPDSPVDGEPEPELGEPVEPAAAGVGVAVTVK